MDIKTWIEQEAEAYGEKFKTGQWFEDLRRQAWTHGAEAMHSYRVVPLEKEVVELKAALEKINENPYPENIFTPLTELEWIDFVGAVRSVGLSLDRISADYGRTLLKPYQKIASEQLKNQTL